MALSQEDRIAISKKIVNIPKENENADNLKAQLEVERTKAEKADNANKSLMDEITPLINGYQGELQRYDGNGRTTVTEQVMIDSADRVLKNAFFPNDPQTPLPSIPDGAWKFFQPFANGYAIGKNYTEGYAVVQKEQDLFDSMNAQIAIIEGLTAATRSTGDECAGVCTGETPPGSGTTEGTCLANGGTWNEAKAPSVTMNDAATELKNLVQQWEDF